MNFEEERKRLVYALKSEGIIKSRKVEEAFLAIPREHFVPEHMKLYAYADSPLPIGFGQTISAPHMVAIMTEELDVQPGDIVLEVGTGSGYQAAILAYITSKGGGHVYTIEKIGSLTKIAINNIAKAAPQLLDFITFATGDGSKGLEIFAPFDKIIVTAAAPTIPEPLLRQLKPGGRLVIPVGSRWEQILQIVDKTSSGGIRIRDSVPCVFVPLVGEYGWSNYVYDY
ncbi:MAG: protein-L-isoaspartate(D-aspartate) O-methyltransferase [Ignisphaera sp.]